MLTLRARSSASLAGIALLGALLLGAASPARADLIYVAQGGEPQLQNLDGWTMVTKQVTRSEPDPNGGPARQTKVVAIRGRVVKVADASAGSSVFFNVLLRKRANANERAFADKAGFLYRFDTTEVAFAPSQLKGTEQEFDSLLDLRWLLSNEDLRIAEHVVSDPRSVRTLVPSLPANAAARVGQILSQSGDVSQDPTATFLFGHGKEPTSRYVEARMGLGGQPFPGGTTPFQHGWLTLLVSAGPPPTEAAYYQAVQRRLTNGEFYSPIQLLPYRGPRKPSANPPQRPQIKLHKIPRRVIRGRGGMSHVPDDTRRVSGPRPVTERRDLLLTNIKPTIHKMLLAAARDEHYGGLVMGRTNNGRGQARFATVVLTTLRHLSALTEQGGRNASAAQLRAAQVGELTREAVIEALEAAELGRDCLFDTPHQAASEFGFHPSTYLPVDPSEVAMAALQVIQQNPAWAKMGDRDVARRLVATLVNLARIATPNDGIRAKDRYRRVQLVAAAHSTLLRHEVFKTLAGASHNGLLLPPAKRGLVLKGGLDFEKATADELLDHGLSREDVSTLMGMRQKSRMRTARDLANVLEARARSELAGSGLPGDEVARRARAEAIAEANRLHDEITTSPFLRHLVELIPELESRDRSFLHMALSQAGNGSDAALQEVVDNLFSVAYDNIDGPTLPRVTVDERRRMRADAMAALGMLVEVTRDPTTGDDSNAAERIFRELDRVIAAVEEGKAGEDEKELLRILNSLSSQKGLNPASTYVPEQGRRHNFAAQLNRSYRRHVAGQMGELLREMTELQGGPESVESLDRMEVLKQLREQMETVRRSLGRGNLAKPE